jgi:RNA polymerase sigma-70 factor (ECF subfamily)
MVSIRGRLAVGEIEGGPAEESALLRAGQAGDRAALEQLLARHKGPLYALCRGMLGHSEDAQDAVQETFLRALRALPRFRGDAAVRTWLFRIAINVCLKWKAAHPPTLRWDEEGPAFQKGSPSPEVDALRRLRMMEALASLTPRQRAVLLLKELEGWSMAEIASRMGWNDKRVDNELYKARRALADWRRGEAAEPTRLPPDLLPDEGERG